MNNYIETNCYSNNPEDFDKLTGLFQIQAFYRYSRTCIDSNPQKQFAMLRIDLYRFKMVNEFCGREEADHLLRFMGVMALRHTPPEGVCGHFRADTFVMCIPYQNKEALEQLAETLVAEVIAYPLSCKLMPAVGICLIDDRTMETDVLCDCANLALLSVKGKVLHPYAFFDYRDRDRLFYEKRIEDEMEYALAHKEFEIYIQPKVNLVTGRVCGGEVLVRWNHPKEGLLVPGRFLDIFERNGFILKLDEYIWEETARRIGLWKKAGVRIVPLSVNISRANALGTRFDQTLISLKDKYRIPPKYLILELTESVFLEDITLVIEAMKNLQANGFLFSMDDYGSGYSSVNMLKDIFIDEVKMDRAFLGEKELSSRAKTIYWYSAQMLHRLGADIVCEGVENQEQAEFLKECGLSTVQGFYFYRPMPAEEFEKLVFGREII